MQRRGGAQWPTHHSARTAEDEGGGPCVFGSSWILDDAPQLLVPDRGGPVRGIAVAEPPKLLGVDARERAKHLRLGGGQERQLEGGIAPVVSDVVYSAHAVLPDGKILVAGFATYNQEQLWPENSIKVVRYTANGALDPTFGQDGVAKLTPYRHAERHRNFERVAMAVAPNGTVYVLAAVDGTTYWDAPVAAIGRLTADGALDTTFGDRGWAFTEKQARIGSAVVQPDGKLVVALQDAAQPLARFQADGSVDAAFASTLRSDIANIPGYNQHRVGAWTQVAMTPAQDFVVGGGGLTDPRQTTDMRFVKITADGHLDTSFGKGQALSDVALLQYSHVSMNSFTLDGDAILAVGTAHPTKGRMNDGQSETRGWVARLDASGKLDATFATNGVADLDLAYDTVQVLANGPATVNGVRQPALHKQEDRFYGVTVDASHRVLAAGISHGAPIVTRLLPNGAVDASFGGDGTIEIASLREPPMPPSWDEAKMLAQPWLAVGAVVRGNRLLVPLAREENSWSTDNATGLGAVSVAAVSL